MMIHEGNNEILDHKIDSVNQYILPLFAHTFLMNNQESIPLMVYDFIINHKTIHQSLKFLLSSFKNWLNNPICL